MNEKRHLINGGDILVRCLLEEQVQYLFGLPGGQLLNMYDAVYRWGKEHGIETVLFRHEQAAAHAADAYARVTNKIGVCFGTVGPGALHLMPGVGAAWADNIPIIAIVPQVNYKYIDRFMLQGNLDQLTMFKPITKYQKSVREAESIPDAVQKAFREISTGRSTPALIEIYVNALEQEIEEDQVKILPSNSYRVSFKPGIDQSLVSQAFEMLANAEKPLIVSGGGVLRAEAWNELKMFAEYMQIPVITSMMGIGTISNDSKCFLGSTLANTPIQVPTSADVILALGCKFSYTMGYGMEPFWNDKQDLIQVDIDPTIIGRQKPIKLGVVGDCKVFLEKLIMEAKNIEKIKYSTWLEELRVAKAKSNEKIKKKSLKGGSPIPSRRLVKEVFEFMEDNAILIIDGGEIEAFALEQIDLYKPRRPLSTLIATGMGHLGVSIPYGIGAKLAAPKKQVISISGDGAFMFNTQDLETAVRLKLDNLIYVVANNNVWGSMKSLQKLSQKKRYIDVNFSGFNYAKCAEGYGCYGEQVSDPDEIKNALKRAKKSGKPAIIDVINKWETSDTTKLLTSVSM
ncbi:MAG: thiamine pyrophosphate-binding protein [Candidatus Lokiarchaeota archaeon]|nr:thiamine pyrophosphate-binding protein [Candidatus Lokiarchaeota archaeon]MBD3340137.1 thiamine pyrophosphate-binding protein [Candidatus Lokiarchaeota archaeon]